MKSVWQSLALGVLLTTVGLVSTGCSLSSDGPYSTTVPNYCDENSDCPTGFCDSERSMCLSEKQANYQVFVTVTPSETSLANPTTSLVSEPLDVEAGAQTKSLDLRIPRSVTLAAFIHQADRGVKAEVRLSRRASIVGEDPSVLTTTTLDEPISGEDGKPANFTARVLRGHTYDLSVVPQGERVSDLPPIRLVVAVPQEATFVRVEGVAYPEELGIVHGRVRDLKSAGVSSVVVRAIDPVTQLAVSSKATTDTQGNFVLHHMLGKEPFLLQLQAEGTEAAVPVFVADPTTLITGAQGEKIIVVPDLLRTPLELSVIDTAGNAVEGAVVTAKSRELQLLETNMQGRFSTSQTTSVSGKASLPLFAGEYEFTVTPPSPEEGTSRLAVAEFSLRVEEPTKHEQKLVERVTIQGSVVRYDQEPMTGVQIEALSHVAKDADFRAHRSNQANVDEVGAFSLMLDQGRYDLVTRPPQNSGLSWSIQPGFEVRTRNSKSPHIELSPPVALHGRVTSEDLELVIGAVVRVYALLREGSEARSILVGRADTDELGEFEILLPPEI